MPGDEEESCEVLSSGHGRATALLNSLWLWSPAQDQGNKLSQQLRGNKIELSGLEQQDMRTGGRCGAEEWEESEAYGYIK